VAIECRRIPQPFDFRFGDPALVIGEVVAVKMVTQKREPSSNPLSPSMMLRPHENTLRLSIFDVRRLERAFARGRICPVSLTTERRPRKNGRCQGGG